MAKHVPFDEACAAEPGVEILSEESLGDGSVATTLRTRSGEMTITDGPFAEAAEQIGGTPEDLDGVLRLCEAEGWPSFPADPERASRVLTAPGVTTVVAVDDQRVVGFAQLFNDGELQAFLANIAVDAADARRRTRSRARDGGASPRGWAASRSVERGRRGGLLRVVSALPQARLSALPVPPRRCRLTSPRSESSSDSRPDVRAAPDQLDALSRAGHAATVTILSAASSTERPSRSKRRPRSWRSRT